MTTNGASRFFFCILFVALLFTSEASSVNRRLDHCDKTIICGTGYCRLWCLVLNHFQRAKCNPTTGCCCHSDG
ncbi:uncharacterized protein DS421_13g404040 [Arachis hypogaea]|nr:uncharacterized protein DS421_13g404040 [Arachis hypogaea]